MYVLIHIYYICAWSYMYQVNEMADGPEALADVLEYDMYVYT